MSLTLSPAEIIEQSTSPLVQSDPNWPRVPLGTVATILNGAAFKSSFFTNDDDGVPLIRIRDISSDDTTMYYAGPYDDRYMIRSGELLVGMDGDFNVARWTGPAALLNQRVCCLRPANGELDIEFLTYLLPGYLQAIHDVTSSTTVKHLSSRDIAALPIPLPKIAEQRQIAARLRQIDVRRESTVNRLTVARAVVDRLRTAVLAAACSGGLTTDWREGSGDAVNNGDGPDAALPTGWSGAKLGDVSRVMLGGTPSRKVAHYWGGDVPWVSSGEVANCRISDTRERITNHGLENSNAKLYPAGTVLIAMIGEGKTRGQAAILDIPAATNQNAAGVLVNREVLDPEFTWRWALSEYERTRAVGRGGNQPALNGQKVRELTIGIPPLDEQREIVTRVEDALGLITRIEQTIRAAENALQAAAREALARAFRGELHAEIGDPAPG